MTAHVGSIPNEVLSLSKIDPGLFFSSLCHPAIGRFVSGTKLMFTPDGIQTDNRHIGTSRFDIIVFSHTGQTYKQCYLTFKIIVGNIIDIGSGCMKVVKTGCAIGKFPCLSPTLLLPTEHLKKFGSLQQHFFVCTDTSANIGNSQLFQQRGVQPQRSLTSTL